jgi:hypothetical protein
MTFRVVLGRQDAEAPAARVILEEKHLVTLGTELVGYVEGGSPSRGRIRRG